MSVPGLRATEREGKVIVEFEDIFRLDLTSAISRIFDHFMGPIDGPPKAVKPNVVDFKEETNGKQTGRTGIGTDSGDSDTGREGDEDAGGGAEGDREGSGPFSDQAG